METSGQLDMTTALTMFLTPLLVELARMEKVRNFLLDNDIVDLDSFNDYLKEIR